MTAYSRLMTHQPALTSATLLPLSDTAGPEPSGRRRERVPTSWFTIAAATVMVMQLTLILTHVPWLDEWQALQIAVQSPDLAALLDNLHYEGHPPLWYLLLRGAAAIFGPGLALSAVQLPVATGIQALVLFRSPFARLERLLLASSFFVLFDFGTLSRSLSLGVLLATVAIAFRRTRVGWIAIALLPMADFLFGVLSLICIAIRWRERSLWTLGLCMWLAAALLAAWSVTPAPDLVPAFRPSGATSDLGAFLVRLSALLVPLQMSGGALQWNNPLPIGVAIVAGPLFLYFGDRQLRHHPFDRLLFLAMVTIALAFSVLVYPLAIRHLSLIAWLLILLKWRERDSGGDAAAPPEEEIAFRLWLVTIAGCGLVAGAVNLVRPFDTVYQAAAAIRRDGLTQSTWAAFPASRAQGVSALTGIEFARLPENCTQSFMRWNQPEDIKTPADLVRALRAVSQREGRFYLLSDLDLSMISPLLLRRLEHIPAGYDGQAYNLYVVRPDLPERNVKPPSCLPRRVPLKLGV